MAVALKEIEHFITQKIAPGVVSHGGKVEILDLANDHLRLGLSGACSTCSLDSFTKEGIAEYVMNEFPELEDCVVIDLEDATTNLAPLVESIKES